jgi:hypothetical protein
MTLTQFHLFCYVWILIALIMLPILLKVKQPYGRHTTKGFGPMINNKIAWATMELRSPSHSVFAFSTVALPTRSLCG